jgi:hypothetical protein
MALAMGYLRSKLFPDYFPEPVCLLFIPSNKLLQRQSDGETRKASLPI